LGLADTTEHVLLHSDDPWTIQLLEGSTLKSATPLGVRSEASLDSLIEAARESGPASSRTPLQLRVDQGMLHWKIELTNITARQRDGAIEVQNLQGRLYVQEPAHRN
jgi:hypothetical protein